MNKRTVRILGLLVLAVVMVTAFSGCDLFMGLFGGNVMDRISSFESDLNSSSRSTIYQNFHPTETTQYAAMKDPNYWVAFSTAYDYEFSGIIASDEELTASATLTVMSGSTEYYNGQVYFTFAEDGFDVLIDDFSGFGVTILQILGDAPLTRE